MKKTLLFIFACLSLKGFSQGAPACPNISTVSSQTICQGSSATLTSTLVTNYSTTSYSVSSIPYSPLPYTGTPILVSTDDEWSPTQGLLFPFCYFGNTYSSCVVGANGHITFDLTQANGYDGYSITTALPSTNDMPANTINAAFRDIDPALGGQIYYQTGGSSPCRYVVISWVNVPLFANGDGIGDCDGTPNSTFQLVLYENTNFIDVYIQNSYACSDWNGALGIIGLLSPSGTAAVCPPGRNMTTFSVNGTPEAWRFTPTGVASYVFHWSAPGNPNFSTATLVAVSPTVTTTYTASMSLTNCNGSSFTTTATQQVVVNASPTVTVNSASACSGTAATLTATGATTYSWTPATGLSGTTGSTVTSNPGSTTIYSVTGTTGGCTNTKTATVTVAANPTVTVNSPTVCAGSSVNLTGAGAVTYTWNTGSTANPLSVTPGATSYTVTGTNAAGCTNKAVSTVTVVANPTVTVNSPTVCAGSSVNLTAAGATTYTWNTGSTANPLSVTPGATSYTVTGTTAGCTNTAVSTVTVVANPTVTVNSPTVCAGSWVNLTAAGATTYTWNTGSNANPLSETPGATSYTVTGTTAGCTNTALSTVTVVANPTVTVNSPTVCAGSSVNLTAAGATTYTWNTGSTANPLSVTPGATSYTVTGTTTGCTAKAVSTVTVVANPTGTVNRR